MYSTPKLMLVFSCFSFITFGCSQTKNEPIDNVKLEKIAKISHLFVLEGNRKQPVFTFRSPILINGSLFFPDGTSSQIFRYSLRSKELINKFGGIGRGPGDLNNPLSINLISEKKL